ncbi:MAG: AsnC family transcriptional regulator [Nitrososphaerota archaeon]|jgi:DNA-binding Lrp family transcriptional regulator|uniref:siroheme decarboxylase subunit alpha n=1 Tax=Candidatus Bathycorpusculum sp. TaxID=2994959 RepID=UPI002828A8CB|nr:AsnC family transcriptional regulator [Candidatus Termitimicrobium sp.]MCL2431499.1 AsnC family transcriptional regulator [Candidatus Termitimicrobium sp.]MDR0492479.1 AsnC family transcriptional regulator [Nitrososphaerota archaeon]
MIANREIDQPKSNSGDTILQNQKITNSQIQPLKITLDETDKKILQILQDDFPIVTQPWKEISCRLNLTEQEITNRINRLKQTGVVLRIGPIFDSAKIGLKASTLVALRVDAKRLEEVSQIINQHDNISHNYQRDNEYNVWFTLTAQDNTELNEVLEQIRQKINIPKQDLLNLPTRHIFKINVIFQLTN